MNTVAAGDVSAVAGGDETDADGILLVGLMDPWTFLRHFHWRTRQSSC